MVLAFRRFPECSTTGVGCLGERQESIPAKDVKGQKPSQGLQSLSLLGSSLCVVRPSIDLPVLWEAQSSGERSEAHVPAEHTQLRNPQLREERRHSERLLSIEVLQGPIRHPIGEAEVAEHG